MRIEWDALKARRNLTRHGVSFGEAWTVFQDPLAATFEDTDHSDREQRFITIGYSAKGHLVVVCHTESGDSLRLISARLATRGERKRHEG